MADRATGRLIQEPRRRKRRGQAWLSWARRVLFEGTPHLGRRIGRFGRSGRALFIADSTVSFVGVCGVCMMFGVVFCCSMSQEHSSAYGPEALGICGDPSLVQQAIGE